MNDSEIQVKLLELSDYKNFRDMKHNIEDIIINEFYEKHYKKEIISVVTFMLR